MKKIVLNVVAFGAMSVQAMAADLPSRRAPPVYVPPPPIPAFSWAGFYVGGQVGYEFGHDGLGLNGYVPTPAPAGGEGGPILEAAAIAAPSPGYTTFSFSGSSHPTGVIGGGHVGYNFVLPSFAASGLVFGIEGDVNGANYRGTITAPELLGLSATIRSDIKGSARGRVGVAVDRVLFYATGGAAFAEFKTGYFSPFGNFAFSHTRVGYTVGGGVEYAFTNNLSLRVEYRYSDYGSFTDAGTIYGLGSATVRHRETDNLAQVGFSYKFDTAVPTPVVARY